MKRILCAAVLAVLLSAMAGAAAADLPPLIDRQLFFGDPQIAGAQLSPDGEYVAFLKPYHDVRNVWVKRREEPFDAAKPVTADSRPVPGYFWSRDSKVILYVQDKGGNENFHVYSVNPAGEPEADTGVPSALDLTPLDNVRAAIYAVPENTPETIIVGLNDRDATYHDVYSVNIVTGERKLLIQNDQKVGAWIFDRDGNVRLAYRQTEDGGTELLRVDGKDLTQIYSVTYLEDASPVGFTADQKQVYLETNKGDDVDLTRLMLLDPATGKTELVESDPEKQVDFGGIVQSQDTHELMATYYVGDRVRIYPKSDAVKRDLALMKKNLPDGELGLGSMTKDMRYWTVSVSSDVDPGSVYLYDRTAGKFSLLYRSRPDLPSENLAPMKPVTYKARDGLMIHAYLTLPKGVPAKNLPTIMFPHGGPWARDTWGYDPFAQFLANRGYAVIQPNFRSSTGYGKKFLNAGNHQWGTGAMQNDLTDGVKWLIAQGTADPKRVAIFGGSYGGYATLAGVTFTPDLYACAIPYCAPSNLITLIESFPAYWRPFLKGSWYMRVGDPEVEADRQDLEARSPLNFVDRIHVPLLVVHGANDPRVKQSESDRIVLALRDKGEPVQYIVAPDEGHGFRSPENRMALAVDVEKFLAKNLGGRAQEDVPPALAARLDSITVDVASLEAPAAPSAAAMADAATAPLPAADGSVLKPTALHYDAVIDMGAQKLNLGMNRTIERAQEGDVSCWKVTDASETPMGNSTDSFDLDAKTLAPMKRTVDGMGSISLTYSADAITGEMGAGGQTMKVDLPLTAPVMADGPGMEVAIAALPISVGYTTTLRMFEPLSQKVRAMKLEVTGKETTQVAAGSFDTYTVEITPLDDDTSGKATLNVMQSSPHHVVKSATKLPAMMGGGMMTTELTSVGGAE
jgi:dipeptidyl aminopeptidase/acylaminoacyl peptidase